MTERWSAGVLHYAEMGYWQPLRTPAPRARARAPPRAPQRLASPPPHAPSLP